MEKKVLIKTIFLLSILFVIVGCSVRNQEQSSINKVEQLLAKMTLEEKVGQMTQIDFSVIGTPADQHLDDPIDKAKLGDAIIRHHVGSILNTPTTPQNKAQSIETWRKIAETLRVAGAKSRLKIPVLYGIDAIHGATYTKN
jgi:beta-glucosidase